MLTFAERSTHDELMDTEVVRLDELRDCLVDLARVNRLTRAYAPTLAFLDRLLPAMRRLDRRIEIVDVGSGYGDLLRAIGAWARHHGVPVSLTGVDLNPWSSLVAFEATPKHDIRWVTSDLFAYMPPRAIDVVTSSLFTHHLADPLVVRFLSWMETNARLGWFVSDLYRHPVPYLFFRYFSKLARFHRLVQHDGPVSISRAFVRADWERLLREAGVDRAAVEIHWRWPFRMTVERLRCARL
jgi:SAM-dependent methyltransferase